MTTWGCKCTGDPVGESAQQVLATILSRAPKEDQEAALQDAQTRLVTRVCNTCWQAGLQQLLWVQTYVEPERKLEEVLRGTGDRTVTKSWFLHRAADIGASAGTARGFYEGQLIPALEAVPEARHNEIWLSNRLADRRCPPVVRFWIEGDSVKCDWNEITVDPLYRVIFTDDRQDGEYLHVAYPCRATDLSQHVGPAGAYVFLTTRRAAQSMPSCLIFHLRAFVQALVTAQLWDVALHLREREKLLSERLRAKSRPFATHHGHLRMFLQAAQGIREIIDPLAIDTSALDIAQLLANDIFDVKDEKGSRRYHRYSDILNLTDTSTLEAMLREYFEAIVKRTQDLGDLAVLTTRTKRMADDHPDVKQRWCLAHACYKGTVSLAVLTDKDEHLGLELTPAAEPRDDQAAEVAQHMLYAATQLVLWKAQGFAFDFTESDSVLSIRPVENIANWTKVKLDIYDWWQGTRWKINEGGDTAEPWARVLRGCAGAVGNVKEWLASIEYKSSAVLICVPPNDARKS